MYVCYNLLTNNVCVLPFIDKQCMCVTIYWQTMYVCYNLLTNKVCVLQFIDKQCMLVTIY